MHLDCTKYPEGHTFAEEAAKALGIYVNVADFSEHDGKRMFRMIVDPEIDKKQMREILFSTIKDKKGTYEFAFLETISGPIVDQGPRRGEMTVYIRITFL